MKLISVLALSALLATGGVFAQGHGEQGMDMGHGKKGHGAAMRQANPMPNLMRVIKKQGDQLGLSEEQEKALVDWREANRAPMHDRIDKVNKMEAELNQAALAGKPKAELMVMASRIMTERTNVISQKADCRDNMRRILTAEQYAKVLELYQN